MGKVQLSIVELAYKLALTAEEAVALTGIGIGTIRDAIRTGDLRAKQVGKNHHILPDDLRAWLISLPDAEYRPRPARIVPTRAVRRR